MRLRKITGLCLGTMLVSGLALSASAEPAKLRLLHLNDVYQISPARGHGGLAEVTTLIKAEQEGADVTLLTFGGDLISPSVMSGLTKGEQMIDLFNAMGVDVAVLGNHEFDFGEDTLATRIGASDFPWLATNVLGGDGNTFGGTKAVWTTDVGQYKVGFFGLLTTETTELSSTGDSVSFTAPMEAAAAAVATLQEDGADVIIALTHLTIAEDRALAAGVDGIDVILGGHEHIPITFYSDGVLIHKSGTDAQFLGVIDLVIDEVERRGNVSVVTYPQWRMVSTRGVAADPEIAILVDGFNAKLDEELNIEIGTTETALESVRASVRTKETTMGNLIADAIRAGTGADVSIANGGGIRGDTVYEPGTVLTRKDILTELPFGNTTVTVALKGADLLAALENGVSRVEDVQGRFPQVSGMTFVFDAGKEAGSRIEEVMVGGAPLDLDKVYVLATNNYVLGGGDGYSSLANGDTLIDGDAGKLMASMVMDYVSAAGTVAPVVEGRIVQK